MTKEQASTLYTGQALDFLNGDRVIISSIDQANQTITFDYQTLNSQNIDSTDLPTMYPAIGDVLPSDDIVIPPPIPVTDSLVTRVICKWRDIPQLA